MTIVDRCQDCDCVLWSEHAKKIELCPECEFPDEGDYDCLDYDYLEEREREKE